MEQFKIPAHALSPTVEPGSLGFPDTSQLPPLDETIGQDRAVEALDFGLGMQSPGFNIYVSGPVGTGKASLVRDMVTRLAKSAPAPPDWCYVNNFQDPSKPRGLSFPAGQGRAFKQAMALLIHDLRREIPRIFESAKFVEEKAKQLHEMDSKRKALFKELADLGKINGFMIEETPVGFNLVPLRNGKPVTEDDLASLSQNEQNQFAERRAEIETQFRQFQIRLHALDHEAEHQLRDLDRQIVRSLLERHLSILQQPYRDRPDVVEYLTQVRDDIVMTHKDFVPRDMPRLPFPIMEPGGRHPDLTRYEVNVIVEHNPDAGAPVVVESHPTYSNLIGKMERKSQLGVVFTEFTDIKAGALLQANGGYLILNALDVLRQPFSWDALKRVMKTGAVNIEDAGEFYGFSASAMRPEAISVSVKVLLLGSAFLYHLLEAHEEDFCKIFKVKADFDLDVPHNDHQSRLYARFIARLCRDETLPHFTADAVAVIIHEGFRLAERHDRLSLRLSLLGDVIREAAFWARRDERPLVERLHVETAVAKRRHRLNLPEQWVQDEIAEGTLIVGLEGEAVGEINGLSVHQLGDYAFGRPCRITARTFPGTKGVIDIQREAELSGHVHSKGVMILAGYLAGKFAGMRPFALNATLTFEQTYSEVEGDSASVAELIAILSSLGDVPVRQYLAVTGSVNQLGDIQPIGGVNEKIEGFFASCVKRGLSGRQGVVIPARNLKHLVLRRDVIEAVEHGRFCVYGVNTVEEALELLTGMPAGECGPDGAYPEQSIYGKVAGRLAAMADVMMERQDLPLFQESTDN